jgi:putative transposase
MKTKARYKFRIYPDKAQCQELAQLFGCVRVVYNTFVFKSRQALESRKSDPNVPFPSYSQMSSELTLLKKQDDRAWLKDVSSVALQQTLRHLDQGWKRCFKKKGRRPTFKKKQSLQSASLTKAAFKIKDGDLHLGKVSGHLEVRWSRELPSEASSCTVLKDPAGRYFVSFVVDLKTEMLKEINSHIGIDLGLTHFLITSEGTKYENPRFLQRKLEKLAKAQRKLSKTKKGSSNREKARKKVARIHARIADARKDYLHKLSTKLIRENQSIGVEALSVKNMVRNRRLARSIHDVSWSMFMSMLEYKSEWYGRKFVKIDRWEPTSKTCSSCLSKVDKLPLNVRSWVCGDCGASHDRDINAALNVKRVAGLANL